jgi:hypothetical protein
MKKMIVHGRNIRIIHIIHPRVLGMYIILVGVVIPKATKAVVPRTLEKFILCMCKDNSFFSEILSTL